jgi:lysine-N-methylase
MSEAVPTTSTAFRYMHRFQCTGSACEATCCSGHWKIYIDKHHYRKTQKVMSATPQTRQEFDERFERVRGVTRSDGRYALMVLQNGSCGFLTEDRLCGLQQRFGEEVLSDTCALYPRALSQSGSRLELAGMPSCPEVARQLLLHADALELVEHSRAPQERMVLQQKLEERPAHAYIRYHDELRNLMIDLLSDEQFSLPSRLSMVAYFGNRTADFLSRDVPTLDEPRLLAEVERIQDPVLRRELDQRFRALPVPAELPLRVVWAFATASTPGHEFEPLRLEVLARYGLPTDQKLAPADLEQQGEKLLRKYEAHKQAWQGLAPRIDDYLTNYAKNYWAREWYFMSPDLLTHTVQLLVRLAVVRFTLLGSPLLAGAIEQPEAERARLLDLAVVDTVYKFSRAYEHDIVFTKRLRDDLASGKLVSLAYAVSLAFF